MGAKFTSYLPAYIGNGDTFVPAGMMSRGFRVRGTLKVWF